MSDFRLEMSAELQAELARLLTQFNNLLEHVPVAEYRHNFEEVYTDTVSHSVDTAIRLECILKYHWDEEVALLELNVEREAGIWGTNRIFNLSDTRLAVHPFRDDAIRWAIAEIETFKPQFEESVTNYVAAEAKAREKVKI